MVDNKENLEKEMKNEEEIKENEEVKENLEEASEEPQVDSNDKKEEDDLSMFKKYKEENKKLNSELEALKDRLLRVTAEYENFRKRTAKEKEGIYTDACVDVLKEIVPNLDNLERALEADGNVEDMKKGVEMTLKGFKSALEKLGVEEIETEEGFDPNIHQAVMHVEDENLDKNSVAEVFMKGYKRGDKVIRHSVVKVAN
ncbi:nucleotide exchange factor GrpE [Eubacterium multiforme]|uniref:Protein GrpE n=1 Tax=Eubacterium multiforme TaxID=83339 RepID=A0ABT9UTY4_9FIRM|nr:nucleotide exchange factor GrpE [Eubacterium multiforme]MDQ0149754.1 molecular chaperone GrpE [Eubacterium multiforme]